MRAHLKRTLLGLRERLSKAPQPKGPHARLKLGLVADELTRSCLRHNCRVLDLTPLNFQTTLRRQRPDLVFVESAWSGHLDTWKYRIAAYPEHPERDNTPLAALVACARELGIPAVFWNKEDGVHFDRFIDSARLFDWIFTVDQSCVRRYAQAIDRPVFVAPLMFAVEPVFHHFEGFDGHLRRANFVGSYGWHVHDLRRERQDMLLGSAARALGLTIYDRNSDRRTAHYRYPDFPNTTVKRRVAHEHTGAIYKSHLVSLNINTVEDSETMFSRRLIEIIACGGLAVTTPARSVDRLFSEHCYVVDNADLAQALFERLALDGYTARDRDMMRAGAERVRTHHTYTQRIQTILDAIGHVGA